ncbi:hypothetical protein [Streptomyces sp. 3213.3]|uniref:hypothetical protein n=1 Tax=Streptomyces sp. 3213.3 TaxID=1855348 RepID=UPI002E0EEF1A
MGHGACRRPLFGRRRAGPGRRGCGGNSRLLRDYPAAQRSQILDHLFKPGYGANLQLSSPVTRTSSSTVWPGPPRAGSAAGSGPPTPSTT